MYIYMEATTPPLDRIMFYFAYEMYVPICDIWCSVGFYPGFVVHFKFNIFRKTACPNYGGMGHSAGRENCLANRAELA